MEIMIDSTVYVVLSEDDSIPYDLQVPSGMFDSTMVVEIVCRTSSRPSQWTR